jgi:hypothetical protein
MHNTLSRISPSLNDFQSYEIAEVPTKSPDARSRYNIGLKSANRRLPSHGAAINPDDRKIPVL